MSQDQSNAPHNPLNIPNPNSAQADISNISTPDFDFQALKQDLNLETHGNNVALDADTQAFLDALDHASQSLNDANAVQAAFDNSSFHGDGNALNSSTLGSNTLDSSALDANAFDVSAFDEIKPDSELNASSPSGSSLNLGDVNNSPDDALLAAAPTKSSFASKFKSKKTAKSNSAGIKGNANGNLNKIILAGLLALLALIAVWFFLGRNSAPEIAPTPAPEVDTPAPETQMPEEAPTESREGIPAPEMTDGAAPINNAPAAEVIDADAILNASIPEDPALIKEEIDRLSDKDTQLGEQGKLIDEQLAMLDKLTQAKEEQIALLEAQIAQLEQQKSSEAKPSSESKPSN